MKKTLHSSSIINWLLILCFSLVLVQCESNNNRGYQQEPIDTLIKNNNAYKNFSIILYDMDYDESTSSYKHQYQLLVEPLPPADTTIDESKTEWLVVSETFFNKHVDDMGMEIAFKKDGVLEKKTAPPGYSNYVGNEKYGHWQTDNSGNSFWAFYGRYAFMSSMFNMMTYPMYRSHYNDYYGNYYRQGRPYYGPRNRNGSYTYGTNSSYTSSTRKTSKWNSRPSSFKSNVRSKAKRSASTSNRSSSSRRSRSNSRYQSSRSRSRSGGFGK